MELKKEIILTTPGMLNHHISEEEVITLTHLKISGEINQNDFDVIEKMCDSWVEFDDDDNWNLIEDESPKLAVLDLGECKMVGKKTLPEFTY